MVSETFTAQEEMSLSRADRWKVTGAVLALAVAVFGFVRFALSTSPSEGLAYFYDLSAKELFTAPHSSVPPIRGVSGEEEDGVRAIVVSATGDCEDEKSRAIAYLETYTPELKRQVEMRKSNATGLEENAPATIRRGEAHGFILVKRPEEKHWHSMTSPEAQKILATLSTPGPNGKVPVVCVP